MINSGKVKNYLLYAIGEIVLVVIGILIALQINNWNEETKDRKLEQTAYCKFLEDVNQDEGQLNELIKDNIERLSNNKELIVQLQEPHPLREKVSNLMQNTLSRLRFKFKSSQSAFEDLKSSGKLNIITDQGLKKELLNYYSRMEGYSEVSDIIAESSLEIRNKNTDFTDIGFQDLYYVKNELESSGIDISKLQSNSLPPERLRSRLLSEAIFHLNTNTRKKQIFKSMIDEILKIKKALRSKCEQR
jgi:hypothetical protein